MPLVAELLPEAKVLAQTETIYIGERLRSSGIYYGLVNLRSGNWFGCLARSSFTVEATGENGRHFSLSL